MSITNTLITEYNGTKHGSMIHPWLRKKQDMVENTPSRRDGISYEDELARRQKGGLFINEIVLTLSHGKGEHGQSGVAITLLNRFFNVHSFKRIDYRDVAAACVFLAGKNEDTPKKLKYVVNHLWHVKNPHMKQFPSENVFLEMCNIVTFLEEMVLKTVAFDLNIDLPHQHVLKLMRDVEKGRNVYKEMVKTAYYMASDVLLITDWSIRYSCVSIATACVNIAAFFHNINMDDIVPMDIADQWYRYKDQTMTRGEVDVMTNEFLEIYRKNPHLHIGSLKKIDPHGKVPIVGRTPPQVTSTMPPATLSSSGSSTNLKKLDLEAYKGRQKTTSTGPSSSESVLSSSSTSTRPSFLPDVSNQKVVEEGLMLQRQQDEARRIHQAEYQRQQQLQQRQLLHQQQQLQQQQRHAVASSSTSNPSQQPQRPSGPPNNHHHHNYQKAYHHEESLKRPMPYEAPSNFSAKKSRMDYNIAFVASSSTVTTTKDKNGYFSQTTTTMTKNEVSAYTRGGNNMIAGSTGPVPLMSVPTSEPDSAYKKMCMSLHAESFQNPYGRSSSPPSRDLVDTTNFTARRIFTANFFNDSSAPTSTTPNFATTTCGRN